jgi:hypothetical protein
MTASLSATRRDRRNDRRQVDGIQDRNGLDQSRDVPHGGIKVVGNTALKLVTVHVVDKGTPMYDAPPK